MITDPRLVDFKNFADERDAVIRRVADLPNAVELRSSQGLGRSHIESELLSR